MDATSNTVMNPGSRTQGNKVPFTDSAGVVFSRTGGFAFGIGFFDDQSDIFPYCKWEW